MSDKPPSMTELPSTFPIQVEWPERGWPAQLRSIPWGLIQQHEAQALHNHCGQTLKRLAERHGLSAMEAVAVLDNQTFHERWRWSDSAKQTRDNQLEAIRSLNEHVEAFSVQQRTENHLADQVSQNPLLAQEKKEEKS